MIHCSLEYSFQLQEIEFDGQGRVLTENLCFGVCNEGSWREKEKGVESYKCYSSYFALSFFSGLGWVCLDEMKVIAFITSSNYIA